MTAKRSRRCCGCAASGAGLPSTPSCAALGGFTSSPATMSAPATTSLAGSTAAGLSTTPRVQAAVRHWQPFAGFVYFHLLLANLADHGTLTEGSSDAHSLAAPFERRALRRNVACGARTDTADEAVCGA